MRFVVIARPSFPIPPEMMTGMIDGFSVWWGRYKGQWNGGFFAGASGGGGVLTVADENELNRIMTEWPIFSFSTIESHALVDVESALDHWRSAVAARTPGS